VYHIAMYRTVYITQYDYATIFFDEVKKMQVSG
jgi:hypothetical protein